MLRISELSSKDLKLRKTISAKSYLTQLKLHLKKVRTDLVLINADTGEEKEFNKYYECCGIRYEEPEPRFFSFNNPFGACPVCQGFSKTVGIDMNLVIPDPNKTIMDGAIAPFRGAKYSSFLRDLVQNAKSFKIPLHIPFKQLTENQVELVKKGFGTYHGIDGFFEKLEQKTYKMHVRVMLSRFRGYTICSACKGSRLRREALQVKIAGKSIYDVVAIPIEHSLKFFEAALAEKLSEYDLLVGERILNEIIKRLKFLNDVGIGYLTMDRLSSTLSGGETQRINLATSLGSSLVGTLYVLDEPTIGLHPRDNKRLISLLKNLRDIGNTVIIVEHDPEMMRNADLIFDMGPKAGTNGGEIIAKGTVDDILKNETSLTGKYLSGKMKIPIPKKRVTKKTKNIEIINAKGE